MVSPLMRGGATPAGRSPQWALMVGGYPVGSRATLTWLNTSVLARSSRRHCLEGWSEISWYKRSGALKGWISWVWCRVVK